MPKGRPTDYQPSTEPYTLGSPADCSDLRPSWYNSNDYDGNQIFDFELIQGTTDEYYVKV